MQGRGYVICCHLLSFDLICLISIVCFYQGGWDLVFRGGKGAFLGFLKRYLRSLHMYIDLKSRDRQFQLDYHDVWGTASSRKPPATCRLQSFF